MPRGGWCIIIAFVGWLSLAAGSPPQQHRADKNRQPQQSAEQSLQQIAAALQRQNEPGNYQRECPEGQDNRRSDLCAQWKAADAAYESSVWTRRAFWLVVAEIVVSVVTMGAAIAAAVFAWLAAKAAQDQLTHAKAVANESFRAYLSFAHLKIKQDPDGIFIVTGKLINHGARNAYDARLDMGLKFFHFPLPADPEVQLERNAPFLNVRPNGGKAMRNEPVSLSAEQLSDLREARGGLICIAEISYRPFPDGKLEGPWRELRIFTGNDVDEGGSRIIEQWMSDPPDENEPKQEHLPLPPPSE